MPPNLKSVHSASQDGLSHMPSRLCLAIATVSEMDTIDFAAAGSMFDFNQPGHAYPDEAGLANDNSYFDFDSFLTMNASDLGLSSAALHDIEALPHGDTSLGDAQARHFPADHLFNAPGPCMICNQIFCSCGMTGFTSNAPTLIDPITPPRAFMSSQDDNTFPAPHADQTTVDVLPNMQMNTETSSARRTLDRSTLAADNVPQEASASQHTNQIPPEAAPPEVVPKPVRKRARIKDAAYAMLDKQFGINAYPKPGEVSSLAKATKLTAKEVKTWFSNARSRRKPGHAGSKNANPFHDVSPYSFFDSNPDRSNGPANEYQTSANPESSPRDHAVSKENLETLNRTSPVASVSSIERFMACPLSEEAVSTTAIAEAANIGLTRSTTRSTLNHEVMPITPPIYTVPLSRALSRAGSVRSFGSARSKYSYGSAHSADSRGSRRGRKQWIRANSHSASLLPRGRSGSVDSLKSNFEIWTADTAGDSLDYQGIFCTWPGCRKRFRHRSDWLRHEGPIHYQPYRWLCCSEDAANVPMPECFICGEQSICTSHIANEHFRSCVGRRECDRDFWRKDHLADHMKRIHRVHIPVPDLLLSAWKKDNASMPKRHFLCGFCGHEAKNWEERNDHVFEHFEAGARKWDWTGTGNLRLNAEYQDLVEKQKNIMAERMRRARVRKQGEREAEEKEEAERKERIAVK